ncbi:type I restriction-modification system subunit M [Sutterella wadsworthensis]|uniref:type I restriction-modification system subunit M n=1 Tax=Sutterella wadsworthensis TaxID=40545 RepID=UPI002659B907|nr:class I SAM-dependent DNA methyltransferase [Sutterella wadsworthensis]
MATQPTDQPQTENFASFIWSVADSLRGPFQEDDYGNIILPFALLRRLECVLQPSRQNVLSVIQTLKFRLDIDDESMICAAAGAPFFNVTSFTLSTIGDQHTLQNIINYKEGFTANVREILNKFDFDNICAKLDEKDKLYSTIHHFQKIDLSPAKVPARAMSNLYEELIWRFATTKHKASKEFLTPRDIVRLATMLVLDSAGDSVFSADKGLIRTIYDPTCGTCGFITDAMEILSEHAASINATAPVTLVPYGQEIANQSWAMGKAMMLLMGDDKNTSQDNSKNIFLGDTLKEDKTGKKQFDFVLSNPPFGSDWGGDKSVFSAVLHEHRMGDLGRFSAGIPPKSDASMLFLQIVANKLNPCNVNEGGRGAIVLSGSPLFTGGAGSGSSEIRRWLFENDLVEAIIQLPGELFYNTSITTYLWILNTNKSAQRSGKVQLIDASSFKTAIKNLGNKRYEISAEQVNEIVRIFADCKDSEVSKLMNYEEFGYRAVTIKRPLYAKLIVSAEGIETLFATNAIQKLSDEERQLIADALASEIGKEYPYHWPADFAAKQKATGLKLGKPIQTAMLSAFTVLDPNGEAVTDAQGNQVWDKNVQVENVPLGVSLENYMQQEVLPFATDAVVDETIVDPRDGEVGIVGYEVNFNRYFYKFNELPSPNQLKQNIIDLESETHVLLQELFK